MIGGGSPLRLLREKWSSPTDLALELYAMLTTNETDVQENPVEIRVREGETALRIVPARPGSDGSGDGATFAARGRRPAAPAPQPPQFQSPARRARDQAQRAAGGPDIGEVRRAQAQAAENSRRAFSDFVSPGVEIGVPVKFDGPVRFQQPPEFLNPETKQFQPVFSQPPQQTESVPLTTYIGTVVGGSGSTWSMSLTNPDTGDTFAADVNIPYIASGESAPVGMTAFPVLAYGDGQDADFYYQPPVWLP